jgi:hypothetical protein
MHCIDVNFVLGLLHCVVVGDVAKVSDVYATSIFRVEIHCEAVPVPVFGRLIRVVPVHESVKAR